MKENCHISYLDIFLWDQVGSHKKSNLYIHVMIKTVIMLCVGLFEIEEYWHYRCYNKSYLVTGMKHPESITTLFYDYLSSFTAEVHNTFGIYYRSRSTQSKKKYTKSAQAPLKNQCALT